MPYELREQSGRYCVYKVGENDPLECYSKKEDALAYLGALEANVEDAKMKAQKRLGSAIKALETPMRVGGYLVRFTNQNDPDLYGEYFDKDTDFWIERGYPVKGERALLEHGLEDFAKVMPIGLIDMVQEDEFGLYVEAKLNDRKEYERMLRDMRTRKAIQLTDAEIVQKAELAERAIKAIVETGKIQWSSGALPQGVVVDSTTGHIESWPIIEGSLTFTPAEVDGTQIAPIKSALEHLSEFLKAYPVTPAREGIDPIEQEADTQATPSRKSLKQGNNTMELLNQIMELLKQLAVSMGMEESAEGEAMASAVVDELKADVPSEDMPEEEMNKAASVLAEKAISIMTAKIAKKQAAKNAAADVFAKHIERNAKPVDPFPSGGSRQGNPANQRANYQISVSESLKYAHLSAEDMAMAWKMAVAATGLGVRGFQGRNATDFVSEEFYKTAMHKMVHQIESRPLARSHEHLEVKTAMPFKANELNASDITGQGLEWLGYAYDSQVWETARNIQVYKTMMARGMIEKPVAQGEKGAYVPIESDDLTVYGGVEGNSVDSTGRPETVYKIQPQTTSTALVQPGTFRTATAYTFQLQEDSFVDMAQEANRKIRIALEENIERAFINADSDATANTNINKIDGTPTSTGLTKDYYLEFDGLRKSPLVTSTAYSRSGTTLAVDDYRQTWALLGSNQAAHKENIFFLIDFSTFQATLDLLPVLTKDVAGDKNSLFTGELTDLWGIPVLMSGFMGLSNTAGKVSVTAGNNTKGQILAVYAPYWAFVFKRNLTIEMQRSPDSESFEFYGSMRFALKRRSASAAAITYNVTV